MKKVVSLLLCVMLMLTGVTTANASEIEKDNGRKIVDLNESIYIPEGIVKSFTYNIEPNTGYTGGIIYKNSNDEVALYFNSAIGSSMDTKVVAGNNYGEYFSMNNNDFMFSFISETMETSGCMYKKVRVKLSDYISEKGFNEDGSLTEEDPNRELFNLDFQKKNGENGSYYDSILIIQSGAAHNAVIPDENGEVEIYVQCKPDLSYLGNIRVMALGLIPNIDAYGLYGPYCLFKFGDVNKDENIDVNDVTEIQFAIAKLKTLDNEGDFYADINGDGNIDVQDVTDFQIELTNK